MESIKYIKKKFKIKQKHIKTEHYNNDLLCSECNELNTYHYWCQQCNSKHFQKDFDSWTSGDRCIDDFIKETQFYARNPYELLEWIPFNKLTDFKYIAAGGFSTVYKAVWLDGKIERWDINKHGWNRINSSKAHGYEVIVKSLDNSSNISGEFLNEWKIHFNCIKKAEKNNLVPLFGFTRDPHSLNYMVVMGCIEGENLRNSLKSGWHQYLNLFKLNILKHVISGLNNIHKSNLVHGNLHDGNILCSKSLWDGRNYISDLGLCKPINNSNNDVYGILPYVAPEVLRGKPYTQASDIYSFAMIMWELTSGVSPFDDRAHDLQLGLSICKGERPKIIDGTPQCYINLMKKCWDSDPRKRPRTSEIFIIIDNWTKNYYYDVESIENERLRNDIREFKDAIALKENQINNNNNNSNNNNTHPQAYHTSRLLDFTKKLNHIIKQEEKEFYNYKKDIDKVDNYHENEISQNIDILKFTEYINEAFK